MKTPTLSENGPSQSGLMLRVAIDPSLFFDDDGRVYLSSTEPLHFPFPMRLTWQHRSGEFSKARSISQPASS